MAPLRLLNAWQDVALGCSGRVYQINKTKTKDQRLYLLRKELGTLLCFMGGVVLMLKPAGKGGRTSAERLNVCRNSFTWQLYATTQGHLHSPDDQPHISEALHASWHPSHCCNASLVNLNTTVSRFQELCRAQQYGVLLLQI